MQKIFKNAHKQIATFVVLEPDTVDRNGDSITVDEILKTAIEFFINKDKKTINTNHERGTDRFDAVYVGSWIAPVDIPTPAGEPIKKGSWLVDIKFLSEETWGKVLNGTITGVSMEGYATYNP